jgi:hypothetical protein
MLWVQNSLVLTSLANGHGPQPIFILLGLCDGRLGPDGQLHGRSVPFHKESKLLGRGVGGPVFGVGEVRKVVGPVRKVEGEVLVTVPPDRSHLLGSLDNEGRDT